MIFSLVKRTARYGKEGRAYSGQLTGSSAIFAGMTNVAIGALLIANSGDLAAWVTRALGKS